MIDGGGAATQRVDLAAAPDFELGAVRVRPARRQLLVGADEVHTVEPRVMQVLVALAEARGDVVSRDQLNDLCWDGRVVGDDSINRCILALRRLARSIDPPPFEIETVARVGYALIARANAAPPRPSAAAVPAGLSQSVAVLPFANLTGDPGKEYLSDGIAEELITTLSLAGGLKVPARTSSFAYRGRNIDVREIARQLGVGAVVEGSLRAAGGRVRLTVQLIDAATGFHIWSGNFDRELGDLLDLQDDLGRSVAAALGRELARDRRDTEHPEAMRLLLQGRSMAARLTGEALARSEALLRQAIALDPFFARAHEGLAGTLLVAISTGALPFAARDEARREAEHALALDPMRAGARGIIASLHALRGEWLEAERNFTAALACDPRDSVVHGAFAQQVLLPTGLHGRAREHGERALELAPARPGASMLCAECAAMRGDNTAVSNYLDMALMLGLPEHHAPLQVMRADCLVAEGRYEEAAVRGAAAVPAVAREAGGEAVIADAYRALAGMIDPNALTARISALFEACRESEDFWRDAWLPGGLFIIPACLGAFDDAYRLAASFVERKRLSAHLPNACVVPLWFPAMAPFRADPRFQDFVGELGLPEYWASAGPPDGYALRAGKLVPDDADTARAAREGGWPMPPSARSGAARVILSRSP